MKKLNHPLGAVKAMKGAAAAPPAKAPVDQAVTALKAPTKLAALAAQASKTEMRKP